MTVYIEYVLIDNFIIDFLLLKTTFLITGIFMPKLRLIICSVIGAVFALLYPLLVVNKLIVIIIKAVFGLVLAFFAGKFKNIKEYVKFTAIFLGLTFFIGGAIIGVFSILGLNYSSEYSVGLMILPVYVCIVAVGRFIRVLYRKKDVVSFTATAEILFGNQTVKLNAFFDTGNALYDGFSPVIIVNYRLIKPILTPELFKTAKKIRIATSAGQDEKFLLKPTAVVIYSSDKKNIFYNVRVCVVDGGFNGYDAILHPALMEKGYEQIAV